MADKPGGAGAKAAGGEGTATAPLKSCQSLAEVRENIDRLDDMIAGLMCDRHHYVVEAAKFKPSVAGVVVPEREAAIIRRVRQIAAGRGVNPDAIEAVYRAMIAAFTRDEQERWREMHR